MTVRKKYTLYLAPLALLLLVGAGLYFFHFRHSSPGRSQAPSETVNYNPPSKDEQKAGNEQKAVNDAEQKAEEQAANSNTASVLISDANQYVNTIEVRAYVSNTVEDGGTCTTVLTNASHQVKKVTNAFADATSTQCGAIDFDRSEFAAAGLWKGTVTYHSVTHDGVSAPFTLTVQ